MLTTTPHTWTAKKIYKYEVKLKTDEDKKLYQLLAECRSKLAKETQKEAYMIVGNRTLNLMAACKPTTKALMMKIPWIAEVKYEQFWELFLDIIKGEGYQESDFISLDHFINPLWHEKHAQQSSSKHHEDKWTKIETRALELLKHGIQTQEELMKKLDEYAEMEKSKEKLKYQEALRAIQEHIDHIKLALKSPNTQH